MVQVERRSLRKLRPEAGHQLPVALRIRGMLEDGENIAAAEKLEDIMEDPDFWDASATLVVSVSEE